MCPRQKHFSAQNALNIVWRPGFAHPLGKLRALPRLLDGFKGRTSKGKGGEGVVGMEGRSGEGKGNMRHWP